MSKLPIFEQFLIVGESQVKTQAKTFLLNWALQQQQLQRGRPLVDLLVDVFAAGLKVPHVFDVQGRKSIESLKIFLRL